MGRVGRREKAEGGGRPVVAAGGGQRAAGLAKAVKLIALLLSRVVGNKSDFLLQLRCSSVNKHKSWRCGATVAYCAAPDSPTPRRAVPWPPCSPLVATTAAAVM